MRLAIAVLGMLVVRGCDQSARDFEVAKQPAESSAKQPAEPVLRLTKSVTQCPTPDAPMVRAAGDPLDQYDDRGHKLYEWSPATRILEVAHIGGCHIYFNPDGTRNREAQGNRLTYFHPNGRPKTENYTAKGTTSGVVERRVTWDEDGRLISDEDLRERH